MQLREHPGLMGRWPPNPTRHFLSPDSPPSQGLDVLKDVHYVDEAGKSPPGLVLETVLDGQRIRRIAFIYDKEFAKALCKFLKKQKGKTMQSIGFLDVTVEFLSHIT